MKLSNKIRSLGRKTKIAVAALTLGIVVAAPFAVQAGFAPDRPTFDYNKAGNGNCSDPANPATQNGRCGSMNGPVFNSFINTPSYGDERSFVDASMSDQTAAGSHKDPLTSVTKGSKEVVVRMYIHNNANGTTNASGKGVAKNTKVRLALPGVEGNALRAVGYISADNATPKVVQDTVDFTSSENFTVAYKPGSATLYTNGPTNGTKLSDSIVTTGAPIGNNAVNGDVLGCFEYEAVVNVTLTVTPKPTPNLQLVKEVKVKGDPTWKKEVSTKPGAEVQWRLGTKNISNANLTEVSVRDILPPHVKLVPGSVRMIDSTQDKVQADAPLFGGGFGLGNYPSGGIRYVIFNTTTLGDFKECEKRVRNVAKAKSAQTPEVQDSADVVITRENCKPDEPKKPVYACESLKLEKLSGRTARFTATASASNGATVQRYIFNFGDGTPELTTDKNVVEHTYANDGQYASRVKVQVLVDGKTVIAEGDKCAAAVTYTTPPTTPPTTPVKPGQPTVLPETGAGSVALTFIAVTAASTLGYYFMVARRSARI